MVKRLATFVQGGKFHVLSIESKFDTAKYKMATGETEIELENTICKNDIGVCID